MTEQFSSKKLSSCPFCGSGIDNVNPAPFPLSRSGDSWSARCGNPACGAEIIGPTANESARRWNRRTTLEPAAAPTAQQEQAAFEARVAARVKANTPRDLLEKMRNRMECHFQPCASYWTSDDDMTEHFDPAECDCELGKPASAQPPYAVPAWLHAALKALDMGVKIEPGSYVHDTLREFCGASATKGGE